MGVEGIVKQVAIQSVFVDNLARNYARHAVYLSVNGTAGEAQQALQTANSLTATGEFIRELGACRAGAEAALEAMRRENARLRARIKELAK